MKSKTKQQKNQNNQLLTKIFNSWNEKKKIIICTGEKKKKIKQKSKKEMKKTYRGGSKMCFILSKNEILWKW